MFKAYGDKNRAKQAVKPQGNNHTGVLYYRVGKNGTETNFLQWFRSWKDYKITEFDAEYRDALREFKRKEYKIEDELKDCIKSQNFEKAIELRDQLRKMRP